MFSFGVKREPENHQRWRGSAVAKPPQWGFQADSPVCEANAACLARQGQGSTRKGLLAPFRPQRRGRNGKKLAASLNAFFSFLRFTALPRVLGFRWTQCPTINLHPSIAYFPLQINRKAVGDSRDKIFEFLVRRESEYGILKQYDDKNHKSPCARRAAGGVLICFLRSSKRF